ncbi:MAG: MGMT family protein [Nostoc sp.]|uniref:MGMT family protein n=1 Tax=Nostoc sp. TaxID=1180 RepID=UPI002FFA4A40
MATWVCTSAEIGDYPSPVSKFSKFERAVSAVARACATSWVTLAILCHWMIRSDGNLGGYPWGLEHKQTLLKHEQEQVAQSPVGYEHNKIEKEET